MVGMNEMNIKQALALQVMAVLLIFFFGASELKAEVRFPTKSEALAACHRDLAVLVSGVGDDWWSSNCRYKDDYGEPMFVCETQHKQRGWFIFCSPWGPDGGRTWEYRWDNEDPECTGGQVLNPYTGQCQDVCKPFEGLGISSVDYPDGSLFCYKGCVNWGSGALFGVTDSFCSEDGFKDECKNADYEWVDKIGGGYCISSANCDEGFIEEGGECIQDGECPQGMQQVFAGTPGAIRFGIVHCKAFESECPAGMLNISGACQNDNERCPMGQQLGEDGTCKWIAEDLEKEGNSDNGENIEGETDSSGNRFSGGDDCNTPPSCSGDPVLCGQTRIQWRIECNTRKNRNITGGSCSIPPVCTGDKCDAMEFSSLIMQWRSACALEKLATLDTGTNQDTNWRAEEVAGLQALGTDTGPPVDESSIWKEHENKELKTNLFGAKDVSQCATGFTLLGHDIEMGPDWWNLASIIGWLIVSCTYLWVALRLGG